MITNQGNFADVNLVIVQWASSPRKETARNEEEMKGLPNFTMLVSHQKKNRSTEQVSVKREYYLLF